MKKTFFLLSLLLTGLNIIAQKTKKGKAEPETNNQNMEIRIPLKAENWDFKAGGVEFIEYQGRSAMKITSNDIIHLKDFNFTNGTIEFDVEPQELSGGSYYFRSDMQQNAELFYLRARAGNPTIMDGIQYAPIIKKVNLWDLLPHFQGPANFKMGEWNHVKAIISGSQMLVYVNDMNRPSLEIPKLEANTTEGSIGIQGKITISNLIVKPNETEGLPAKEGFDPTHHDNRYIENWQVTQPVPLPLGKELFAGDLPKKDTTWHSISAERRGLVNLTRLYGLSESRRMVWLKVKLKVATEQKRKLDFGFSDEVWVFLNGRMTYVDKNLYPQGMRKIPDGRISTENASFELALKAGENELLIGIANDFYGWGIIARLDSMEGIIVE